MSNQSEEKRLSASVDSFLDHAEANGLLNENQLKDSADKRDCVLDQVENLGQVNRIGGRFVVLVAGIGDRWFDERSDAMFAWICARQGFKLGRANAFFQIRQLIGAKHDY